MAAISLIAALVQLSACSSGGGGARDSGPEQDAAEAAVQQEVRAPEWAAGAVMYEVNVRQYTKEGTFKAFEEHLPRLREMGSTFYG